jgi:hypothetical protein
MVRACNHIEGLDRCISRASYGLPGDLSATKCSKHKSDDMEDIVNKRCDFPGCKSRSSFGLPGKISTKCGKHKSSIMENLVSKRCGFPGCKGYPIYGLPDDKIATKCMGHKTDNMENIISKRCEFLGCKTYANFGLPGSKIATNCGRHKTDIMEDIKNKNCDFPGCKIRANFGLPGSKIATKCGDHKTDNMEDIKNKNCDFPGCKKRSTFGLPGSKKANKCGDHKTDFMEDVLNKKCTGCGLTRADKSNNFLCSSCNPNSYHKSKENDIKKLLEERLPEFKFVHNKRFKVDISLNYFPDFLFECKNYFIILECDEDAHKGYGKDCEINRMNAISFAISKPTKFIRYNPDFKDVSTEIKQQKLIETLNKFLTMDFLEDPTALYLFYH